MNNLSKDDNIDEILQLLNEIKVSHENLKNTIDRMDEHITFVESVFNVVKIPFFSLMNAISRIPLPDAIPTISIPLLGTRQVLN